MDKSKARDLSAKLQAHLNIFAKENNISAKVGNGRFSTTSLTLKIEFIDAGTPIRADTLPTTAFVLYAAIYGLKAEDIGRTFDHNGRKFKIVGLKPNRPKYPIIGEDIETKKHFKFHQDTVTRGLR